MDPGRVRAYLQVACAGLGFDIGEIWWSTNDNGASSALMAIEEKHDEENNAVTVSGGKKLRFVQLYTSKSYEDRRNMLVKPADEEENYNSMVNGSRNEDNNSDLEKHVLSPLLVDAISRTAQVVWSHTRKQEGLLGRSDIRLQTAVGMPVAVDGNGNMCVVVMFSPNNIQSTDDAMEYLQSISRSATSSSIPSLLPAFDPKQGLISLPHHHPSNELIPLLTSPFMSDGVVTRFVSLDDAPIGSELIQTPEMHSTHDLSAAPKDCFGIPMLPSMAELGGTGSSGYGDSQGATLSDAFDEASYGVWSTIMETMELPDELTDPQSIQQPNNMTSATQSVSADVSSGPVLAINKPEMPRERQDRLEEFGSAFLDVSVFDVAEVWVPIGGQSDYLGQVTCMSSTDSNEALNEFTRSSGKFLIKYWSGAIGRAFSSGNPVWSANQEVFVDSGRTELFSRVKIETALAVPVFSGKAVTPSFIFCCYSFVRTTSVPFVLKFVQQALRLLWDGLDKVQPHKSVGQEIWKDVAPADLGEMAADVEMHQHFMIKKRPHNDISPVVPAHNLEESSLAFHLESLETPSGVPSVRSIYTGSSPQMARNDAPSPELVPTKAPIQYQTVENIHHHIQDAVRSVGDMQPVHQHVATNEHGSKRAHVFVETVQTTQYGHVPQQTQPPSSNASNFMRNAVPLPMPRPLPLPNQILLQPTSNGNQTTSTSSQHHPYTTNYQHQQNQQIHAQETNVYYQETNGHDQNPISQTQVNQIGYAQGQYRPEENHMGFAYQQTQQQTTQYGQSQHFNHTPAPYAVDPTATAPVSMHSMPVPTSVASIPTDQLSATGISFPVPPNSQPIIGNSMNVSNGSVPVSQSPVAMAPQTHYCMTTHDGTYANVGTSGKPCRIQGCGEPSVARRPYCVHHSGNRMCEQVGCGKCAQGSTRFCIAHGGGRRCTFQGCDKGARDKFFCAAHGGGKRCKFDNCNKSAVGGSALCTAHGGGRRCAVDGCDKSAQSSTKFCVKHGGGKKCLQNSCDKVARGRTQYCAAHGGGVRCKLEGCNRVAIGKNQLCRAHGGGARSRGRNRTSSPEVPLEEHHIQGFLDMASV